MSDVVLQRPARLCDAGIIVDGFPGCGKTMLSAIVASLARVELLKYSYEIEQACIMHDFELLDLHSASQVVRYQLDLIIYNLMMGRDLNFRYSDLSSVFNARRKLRYVRRIFGPGDEVVPERILRERPILHLATHGMSAFIRPILAADAPGVVFLNMHRHPLFLLKQNTWNMQNLINSPRHFALYYRGESGPVPFYCFGQEERMRKASAKEKAIFVVEWLRRRQMKSIVGADPRRYYELTFESLVLDPEPHIEAISALLKTSRTAETNRVLKKEKIPRTLLTAGRSRPIYKRVGWNAPTTTTREDEMRATRDWAYSDISAEARESLDWLCADYETIAARLDAHA